MTERWYHGIAARDGDRVCALMTAKARAPVSQSSGSCADAVESTTLTSAQRDAMSRVEVDPEGVSGSGDSARVPAAAVSVGGRRSTSGQAVEVVRDGSAWLVDDVG